MSIDKKQIARLIAFTNQRLCAQRGRPLDECDQSILEQALRGEKLKDIQVKGWEGNTIRTVRGPALWRTLSSITEQKIGIKNVQQALNSAQMKYEQSIAISMQAQGSSRIFENLPAPTYTKFVGRAEKIERLLELLSPNHAAHLITISGMGGIGKTSLAVECARRCFAASQNTMHTDHTDCIPQFELFLFVSAKLSHLGFEGLIPRPNPSRSLAEILQQIADVMGTIDLAGIELKEQIRTLKKELLQKSTLLIVDNLETVENQAEVIGFLFDLPPCVKVIITTREQRQYEPIRLAALTEQDTLSLIQHEATARKLTLTQSHYQALCQATNGVPLAVSYLMGQIQSGYYVEDVLAGMRQPTHRVAQYCFEAAVQPLRGTPSHQILMALALLPAPALHQALVAVAIPEQDIETANLAMAELRHSSLVSQIGYRYSMLTMTQEYMLAELKTCPEFAVTVRQRWIDWYLNFSQGYANRDGVSWQTQFDGLPEEWLNVQAIAQWAMDTEQYSVMLQLWQHLEAYTYAMGRKSARHIYWADRLSWTSWLIQAGFQHHDLPSATQIMLDRAWTLVATRKAQLLPEAEQLLQQAWDLRHHHQNPQFQIDVALKMAVMKIEQNQFPEAKTWFKEIDLLVLVLSSEERERLSMKTEYYRGMCEYKTSAIAAAKRHFEATRHIALLLQEERITRMSENWLADIAVLEGDLKQAEQWLEEGLRMAKTNQDLPHMAFTKRSLAKLYHAKDEPKQAQKIATEAIKLFTELEMLNQAEDTQSWLNKLMPNLP